MIYKALKMFHWMEHANKQSYIILAENLEQAFENVRARFGKGIPASVIEQHLLTENEYLTLIKQRNEVNRIIEDSLLFTKDTV